MSISPAYIAFKMAMEISPIILTGGIAKATGGALPILALTENAFSLLSGALSGGSNPLSAIVQSVSNSTNPLASLEAQLDSFFAHYTPLPGASLINNQVATYPFANQQVAANAIIAQPLNVSMRMLCPVRNLAGYPIKFAVMTGLQKSLTQHVSMGGLFSVVTPSYIYINCILTGLRDVSAGGSNQGQFVWQWDFTQPLVTQQAATQALNSLTQTLTNGTQPSGGTPSLSTGLAVGNPTTLFTSGLSSQSGIP